MTVIDASKGPDRRGLRVRRLALATAIAGGMVVLSAATAAWGAGTMTATPATGLTNGQGVALSGSGFTPSSTGNILECNNAPNEPTVALPAPVSSAVAVGCTAPGYAANGLTSTSATGTITKTYNVVSGTIGPPCGVTMAIVATCPATDSAGKAPAADAANYPCPPTPAQAAAGVTCSLKFGDQANDSAEAVIAFQGQVTATTTPAPVATTTPVATTAPTPVSSPSTLANTGAGPRLWLLLVVGVVLMNIGALLWLVTARRASRRAVASRPARRHR